MKILAIGAHADDVELGIGGTISRHTSEGHSVSILLVTHSAYSDFEGKVIRSREIALSEAIAAAKIMGTDDVSCLDYETKCVTYDVKLIEDINRHISKVKPDVIYTHWDGDINQDHSAISQATIVAGRNIPRILMYRSNWYKSYKHFDSNFYVDISDHIDTKVSAIRAHESETSRRGEDWVDFFKNQCRNYGQESGVRYAEAFQIIKWLI